MQTVNEVRGVYCVGHRVRYRSGRGRMGGGGGTKGAWPTLGVRHFISLLLVAGKEQPLTLCSFVFVRPTWKGNTTPGSPPKRSLVRGDVTTKSAVGSRQWHETSRVGSDVTAHSTALGLFSANGRPRSSTVTSRPTVFLEGQPMSVFVRKSILSTAELRTCGAIDDDGGGDEEGRKEERENDGNGSEKRKCRTKQKRNKEPKTGTRKRGNEGKIMIKNRKCSRKLALYSLRLMKNQTQALGPPIGGPLTRTPDTFCCCCYWFFCCFCLINRDTPLSRCPPPGYPPPALVNEK